MYAVLVTFHVLACLALILIVLLQTGRGAEMGAAFGGASQTLFGGGGGSSFLSKLTTGAAVVFMITCLTLTYLGAGPQTKSIMENVPVEKPQGPVLPEAKPVQPMPEQSKAGGGTAEGQGAASIQPQQPGESASQEAQPANPEANAPATQPKQ